MTAELLSALIAYAFVTSATPGPNNVMLLASGVNFGFRRSIPHMLGIGIGFSVMVILVGLGLAGVFVAWPPAHAILQTVSAGYMLWLAWKIAQTAPPDGQAASGRPLNFLQAAAFQWVNPKAWVMALGAVTLYAPGQELPAILWVAAVFAMVNLPTVSLWTALGVGLTGLLSRPRHLRRFNRVMALLLVASLYPVLRP